MKSASPWRVSKTNNKPDVCGCCGINRLSVSLGTAQIKLENCVTSNKNGIDMRGRFLSLITVKMESDRLLHLESVKGCETDLGEGGKEH